MAKIQGFRRRGASVFNALSVASGAVSDTFGSQITGLLRGSKTFDWASIAAAGQATTTVTVTGAAVGDICLARMSISGGGLMFHCDVTAANTATVTAHNGTAGAIDLGSGTLSAVVIKEAANA